MTRQAVILAGGLGTRLRTVIGEIPKALAEVGGKPVLGHQLDLCHSHGFDDVVLLLGHGADAVRDYVGDGSRFGVACRFVAEEAPLGTAGAVLAAKALLQDDFLVMYCDTMLDVDLDRFWRFARERGAAAALATHPNDHPFDSDLVVTDEQDRITAFSRWREDGAPLRNLASAALYVMKAGPLRNFEAREGVLDFGRHVFPAMIARGETLVAYRTVEYIKDLGTPERLAKVNRDLETGKVDPSRSGRPRPAVFLDRDGVINVERDGIIEPTAMELNPGAAEGVRQLNAAGLATIVVTNQPYVSHGTLSESALDAIHATMERDLARGGAFIDAVYYCPHHPHKGFSGERAELKIACDCRKPSPGMIFRARDDLHLDLNRSWMIGDRTADLLAARNAGLRAVLVRSGHGGKDRAYSIEPDFTFEDLSEAARFIVSDYPAMRDWGDKLAETAPRGGVVLIGGLARAGKTTWARALRDSFEGRNLSTVTLSLDDWLKDDSEREPGVHGRYDLAAVRELLAKLSDATGPVEASVPIYDRFARKRIGERTLTIPRGAFVICEGVPALALDAPRAIRLFAATGEERRRERFESYYRWRGESPGIETYWIQRARDETPAVVELCGTAEPLPIFAMD